LKRFGYFLAFSVLGLSGTAGAQSVPRIKAVVVSFDGSQLTVMPDGDKQSMRIGVRPATRILQEQQKTLADIQGGDFIGATVTKTPAGVLKAQEVHIFPAALRSSGEGLYPATPGSSRFILNGTVTEAAAPILMVKFRGADGAGAKCAGRAPVNPLNGCQGNATVSVDPSAPIIVLVTGNKSLLIPGAVLALSVMAGPNGKPVTPGLTVESVATPPVPLPVTPRYAQPARRARQEAPLNTP
jgi:hypothetical protein